MKHRLSWWQVAKESMPIQLYKYTSLRDGGNDGVLVPDCPPPPSRERGFRVIVSTCGGSGQLRLLGWGPGSFTHIFVDEVRSRL